MGPPVVLWRALKGVEMTKQQEHDILMKCFGRIPERYTLYLLPDDKRGGQEHSLIGMTIGNGEVLIFEFDFSVPGRFNTPWENLENSIPHQCSTCEWNLWRGKGTSYCTETEEINSGECPYWEISPDALSLAAAEYYKQLHKKHYG